MFKCCHLEAKQSTFNVTSMYMWFAHFSWFVKRYSLFNYIHIYSFALECAVFVFFMYMKWEKFMESCSEKYKNYKDIAAYISGASLGIYLTHRLVMSIELNILRIDRSVLFWRIGFPFVTYLVCLMIVLTLKKIPVFKHIVP